ncbi:hypothetical protein [Desulfatitalea alkaliphila]|uniref:Nucleic-acid-binding protein containing Zn-ribbon domain n=1 Tax=Desulfatitalea alkaliphila TaxID=2929485 RepID=A0AA41ULQ4_9BACT|nr:hypothetical protein [Desulfatitalea alkaliphila]MCJ8501781.1 hypothetical protein [Desulfatitalea alkaliphila]
MRDGRCPRCQSKTVYQMRNGVTTASGKNVFVRGTALIGSAATDRMTLVCTTCGHYEHYLTDAAILKRVAQKWDKVG